MPLTTADQQVLLSLLSEDLETRAQALVLPKAELSEPVVRLLHEPSLLEWKLNRPAEHAFLAADIPPLAGSLLCSVIELGFLDGLRYLLQEPITPLNREQLAIAAVDGASDFFLCFAIASDQPECASEFLGAEEQLLDRLEIHTTVAFERLFQELCENGLYRSCEFLLALSGDRRVFPATLPMLQRALDNTDVGWLTKLLQLFRPSSDVNLHPFPMLFSSAVHELKLDCAQLILEAMPVSDQQVVQQWRFLKLQDVDSLAYVQGVKNWISARNDVQQLRPLTTHAGLRQAVASGLVQTPEALQSLVVASQSRHASSPRL